MRIERLTLGFLSTCGSTLAARWCDESNNGNNLCYAVAELSSGITVGVAISGRATKAPFDLVVSISAPKSAALWAGIAWAARMPQNPLTIGYPAGDTGGVTLSSRRAEDYVMPTSFGRARYAVLPSTTANETHWRLDALCSGCSQWKAEDEEWDGELSTGWNELAYAFDRNVPIPPDSPSAIIQFHGQNHGYFRLNLAEARNERFDKLVSTATGSGCLE